MKRRKSYPVFAGNLQIGGGAPVCVQSMLNAPSDDASANVKQAGRLRDAGCSLIRVAIPDMESVKLIPAVKKVGLPVCADIHFDYRLAIAASDAGVDAVRINPGNIGSGERIKKVVDACLRNKIPIRIGVNGGSLPKDLLEKYGGPSAGAVYEAAAREVGLLREYGFHDIAVSLKSSDVAVMVEACEKFAADFDCPMHLGVTEAGCGQSAVVKSASGIGALLLQGIGDTIRVSLTDDPVKEVRAGFDILSAVGLSNNGVSIVSCPTCGRTKIDVIGLVQEAEKRLKNIKRPITVAIMGCAVNGPGEASRADIGIAGGIGEGLLFKRGKILYKVPEDKIIDELLKEINKM